MKNHNFIIGPTDTDSISICKPDMSAFSKEEISELLRELNEISPEFMIWADDGYYPVCLVIRAKNYVLVNERGEIKIKGSALKATNKEKALKRFLGEAIDLLLKDRGCELQSLYESYAKSILSITDMSDWCSKYTITKAVLTGKGAAQVRIREALKGRPVQEGDKVYQFFKTETERCMLEDFDGNYDVGVLLGKLYDTLCVLETVIDVKQFKNYSLQKYKTFLWGIC